MSNLPAKRKTIAHSCRRWNSFFGFDEFSAKSRRRPEWSDNNSSRRTYAVDGVAWKEYIKSEAILPTPERNCWIVH
jgi:hypothetical protein